MEELNGDFAAIGTQERAPGAIDHMGPQRFAPSLKPSRLTEDKKILISGRHRHVIHIS
jgi:hypothetical protein